MIARVEVRSMVAVEDELPFVQQRGAIWVIPAGEHDAWERGILSQDPDATILEHTHIRGVDGRTGLKHGRPVFLTCNGIPFDDDVVAPTLIEAGLASGWVTRARVLRDWVNAVATAMTRHEGSYLYQPFRQFRELGATALPRDYGFLLGAVAAECRVTLALDDVGHGADPSLVAGCMDQGARIIRTRWRTAG